MSIAKSTLVQGGHVGHLSDSVVIYIRQRQRQFQFLDVDSRLNFKNAYIGLQAWKVAILSELGNVIGNWVGADVCNYK